MRGDIIRKFILTWRGLLCFSFVIALVCGIQWGVAVIIRNNTTIARNAECTSKSFDGSYAKMVMKLDCAGSDDETDDTGFIAAYLQKPGPFTCNRYNWAYASCKLKT